LLDIGVQLLYDRGEVFIFGLLCECFQSDAEANSRVQESRQLVGENGPIAGADTSAQGGISAYDGGEFALQVNAERVITFLFQGTYDVCAMVGLHIAED